jgi:hypothetical protein
MLGYKEEDVLNMVYGLKEAQLYLPPGKAADKLRSNVDMARDFLEGLLVEGRI